MVCKYVKGVYLSVNKGSILNITLCYKWITMAM